MAQTGIPFGAVEPVTDWLGFGSEPIGRPPQEHPKRPVDGFACRRNEVSGQRVWSWARQRFGSPEAFFSRFFIGNYCPLLFLEAGGRNVTPDKLQAADREPMMALCNRALRRQVEVLQVEWVIAFGVWAERQARDALAGLDVQIGRILHPSPASPMANRGWAEQATAQLRALGLEVP
jgi:single-strand selective monofunctional uracil DNA glycosylase